jgi:hypothetical protein
VFEEGGVVALVQVDAVEAGADAVSSAGVVLVEGPGEGSGEREYQDNRASCPMFFEEHISDDQNGDCGRHRTLGEVEAVDRQSKCNCVGEARAIAGTEGKEKHGQGQREHAVGVTLFHLLFTRSARKGTIEKGRSRSSTHPNRRAGERGMRSQAR